MTCQSLGARKAANEIYRVGITGPDSLDLGSGPLPRDEAVATFNRGIQAADGGTVVISFAFLAGANNADVSLINWGRDDEGNFVPLSVRDLAQATAGGFIDSDGHFLGSELIEPINATAYEIRVRAVTGEITKIRTWTY